MAICHHALPPLPQKSKTPSPKPLRGSGSEMNFIHEGDAGGTGGGQSYYTYCSTASTLPLPPPHSVTSDPFSDPVNMALLLHSRCSTWIPRLGSSFVTQARLLAPCTGNLSPSAFTQPGSDTPPPSPAISIVGLDECRVPSSPS